MQSTPKHQSIWSFRLGIVLLAALSVSLPIALISLAKFLLFVTGIQRATLSVVAVITIACCFNSALYDDLMGDFLCVCIGLLLALGVQSAHQPRQDQL